MNVLALDLYKILGTDFKGIDNSSLTKINIAKILIYSLLF